MGEEAELELTVIGHNEGLPRRSSKGPSDLVRVLLQSWLILSRKSIKQNYQSYIQMKMEKYLKVRSPRGQATSLSVEVQRAVNSRQLVGHLRQRSNEAGYERIDRIRLHHGNEKIYENEWKNKEDEITFTTASMARQAASPSKPRLAKRSLAVPNLPLSGLPA